MSAFPASLENLIDKFASLPGIGKKSAQRLAFYVLGQNEDYTEAFSAAIRDAKKNVHYCKVCQNVTEEEVCSICSSRTRDKSVICVVSEPRDVLSIERGREYNGTYHVLHGVLSPMSHIGPDDIKIKELSQLVKVGWYPDPGRHEPRQHRRKALLRQRYRPDLLASGTRLGWMMRS